MNMFQPITPHTTVTNNSILLYYNSVLLTIILLILSSPVTSRAEPLPYINTNPVAQRRIVQSVVKPKHGHQNHGTERANIDHERAEFEQKLIAYRHNQDSGLSGSIHLIREYQLNRDAAHQDPAQAARYENYIVDIIATEKNKFADDLKKYHNDELLSVPHLKSRWGTVGVGVDESTKQRAFNYLQQINRAHAIKTGIAVDIVDLEDWNKV